MCTVKLRRGSTYCNRTVCLILYSVHCAGRGLVSFETAMEVLFPSLRGLWCGAHVSWLRIYAGVTRPWFGFVERVASRCLFVPVRVALTPRAGVLFENIPVTSITFGCGIHVPFSCCRG